MDSRQGIQPTIFLVENDDETRSLLVRNLWAQGYQVIVAVDEEDALAMVGDADADIILVNLAGKTAKEVLAAGRRVRQHSTYNGRTSLVVVPERYAKGLEDTEVNVGGREWVFYLGEGPDRLRDLLARLTAGLTSGRGPQSSQAPA
jgi:DNA-binding response OmpR family regulator